MCVCKHWGHNTWTNTSEQTACTIWSDCCNLIRDNRTYTIKLSTHHALYTRLLVCAIRVSGFWWVKSPTKTVLDVYTLWYACFEAHWIPGKREIDELPDEDHQKKQLAERDWVSCYQLSFDIRCQLANLYIPAVLGVVISSLLQVYKLTCHSSVHDHLRTKYRGYTPCTFHFQHSPPPPTHTSPHTLHPHTPSQVFYQVLNFGMIVSSALMIWKGLMVVTGSESPIVVVLR